MPLTIFDDEGEEVTNLPMHWVICSHCNGEGKTSAHLGVVDPREWEDDDFDDYINGAYDKPCGCDNGKVKVLDYDRLTDEQKRWVDTAEKDEQEYQQMSRMERLMGA